MKETSVQATAVVTLTLEVHLTQPWTGDATIGEVDRRARKEALERLTQFQRDLATSGIKIVGEPTNVRITLHTKVP